MGKSDDLVRTGKNHVMVPHDSAAPDSADADFLFRPLLPPRAPVVDIGIGMAELLIDRIRQRQSSAAGGVRLQVVVLLQNLHVEPGGGQHPCGVLQKLQEQVDAQGHVGRAQQGNALRGLLCLLQQLLAKPRGAEHAGQFLLHAVIQHPVHCRGCGKIHHAVRLHIAVPDILIDRIAIVSVIEHIYPRHQPGLLILLQQAADDLSHFSVASVHDNPDHMLRSSFTCESPHRPPMIPKPPQGVLPSIPGTADSLPRRILSEPYSNMRTGNCPARPRFCQIWPSRKPTPFPGDMAPRGPGVNPG